MKEIQPDCQINSIHFLGDGSQESITLVRSVRLWVRRTLGPSRIRMIKNVANDMLNQYARLRGKHTQPDELDIQPLSVSLKAGDQVHVRSKEEIAGTLNHFGQLKGCSFAPEMEQFCNTDQVVLKPVERFVDERDMHIRKTKGIVLLEGIICHGTSALGACDRNCYYFWREEWLERNY